MAELPTVSALVAAFNYERYVGTAVLSALAQDYPAELIEVVVVDDGSSDGTAEVVREIASRFPQREIRLVRQTNGGLTAATNTALAHARGEILAVLDADDVWLPGKIRRNVEMLATRPELGLVFSDMGIVGAEDQALEPSLFAWAWQDWRPPRGQTFARLLAENFVTASSIAVRASLRPAFDPIPAEIPYCDWWLAVSVARVAELDYADEPLALYRLHGANLTGGAVGDAAARERRKDLAFQRQCLRRLPLERLSAADALAVWEGVERKACSALAASGSAFTSIVEVDEDDRAEALGHADHAAPAAGAGAAALAAQHLLKALAADPFRPDLRHALRATADIAALPDPLAGSRPFVTLVDAEELIDDDELLRAFARELCGTDAVSLVIDASRMPPAAAVEGLRRQVARCGLDERDDVHLLAVVGDLHESQRARLLSGAQALYGRAERPGAALPSFTPESLPDLRALAA